MPSKQDRNVCELFQRSRQTFWLTEILINMYRSKTGNRRLDCPQLGFGISVIVGSGVDSRATNADKF